MKQQLFIACLYTVVSAALLGLLYPVCITVISQLAFPEKANGQLMYLHGKLVGSKLIGQPFTGAGYFHSRPSAAGSGYDATASSGSNLAPSSQALVARIANSVALEDQGTPIPVDLVTASASGLDPSISPAAALYQIPRIARERHLPEQAVRALVVGHIIPRQFGLLGEPTINVLQLNLDLKQLCP